MSSSASHALSEVEVFCAEKDSGFFAALRMTQKKRAPARVAPAPTSGYAKLSLKGAAKKKIRGPSASLGMTQKKERGGGGMRGAQSGANPPGFDFGISAEFFRGPIA
jgi:hypothetical protein